MSNVHHPTLLRQGARLYTIEINTHTPIIVNNVEKNEAPGNIINDKIMSKI
jgi:hypothetical protein